MKIRFNAHHDLILHRSILRKPIDAVRGLLGHSVQPRERSLSESIRPIELRPRQPLPATPTVPPTLPRFAFEPSQPSTDIQLNVADIRQKKLNACGDAVVQVMLAYHGLPHSNVGTNDRRLLVGLRPHELGSLLKAQGLQPFGLAPTEPGRLSIADISQWLRRHGPLIAGTNGHFVVLTGVNGSDVIVHCPLLGRRRMPIDGLNQYLALTDRRPVLATRVAAPTGGNAGTSTSTTTQNEPNVGHRVATRVLAGVAERQVRAYDSRPEPEPDDSG